jgi:hypothetical protein
MTTIKISIVSLIIFMTTQLPQVAPKQEVKDVTTAQNMPIVTVEKPLEQIDASPVQLEKPAIEKTEEIEDGVWEWRDLVTKYFPKDQQQNALRIMSKENGAGDPNKVSVPNKDKWRSQDYGLFQLNDHWQGYRVDGDVEQFKNPEKNVKIAYDIWSEQGWKPWSTAKKLGL